MDSIILVSLVSFFVAFTSIPVVIKISDSKKLFDNPGARKVHFTPIPSLGGVGLFAAIIFSICALVPFASAPWIQYFIAASVIVFFLGMKDDILLLSPMKKFTGQFLAAFLLSYQGHFQLTSLYGFIGMGELHPIVSMIFTYLTVMVIINAFNLIDGVDGLAGTLGLISTLFFGVVFMMEKDMPFAALAFATSAALVGFLIYNFAPAKIFMGDTGSLFLGLINAVLVIHFINVESINSSVLHFTAAPAIGVAALFVPLMDTLRVSFIRIYNGRSPFDPDKNHIHHILLKRGYSHAKVTMILAVVSIMFIGFAILAQPLGINFLILSLFALAFTGVAVFNWGTKISRIRVVQNRSLSEEKTIFSSKVITPSGIKDLEINN